MSVNQGLTLFPPPPAKQKPSRKTSIRRNATSVAAIAVERSKSPEVLDGKQSDMSLRGPRMSEHQSAEESQIAHKATPGIAVPAQSTGPSSASPAQASSNTSPTEPQRSYTSFSDAPTLVRSYSNVSQSLPAKVRLNEARGEPSMIRSMFPRYNHEVSLEQQAYFPTQGSPTHLPRTMISKASYSPESERNQHMRSPLSAPPAASTFPRTAYPQDNADSVPEPSSIEELKALWKVTNGWRVSASEGRTFCLRMTSAVDAPVHTLSSSTHPFYTIRLDPTSTSALLTMSRLDPYKSSKRPSSPSSVRSSDGLEVLTTTMEEPSRRFAPNDGLVALLYPKAAANMALDLSSKPNADGHAIMVAAEHECARLVWDEDSRTYYLCHPAMSVPFTIEIESSPAWSKVEYTLEHSQLRRNLVKLTRDGSGGGYLEVDTGVAAMIDSFYIADVAICAVALVAIEEEKRGRVERFAAPPTAVPMSPNVNKARSFMGKKKTVNIEEMEIDLESQSSLADKNRSNLPASTRGILGLLFLSLKLVIWILTLLVNTIASIIIGLSKCITKE